MGAKTLTQTTPTRIRARSIRELKRKQKMHALRQKVYRAPRSTNSSHHTPFGPSHAGTF